jgi:hypothetical protein
VDYLKTNNALPIVVLSADATEVLGCVGHHEKTNSLVGFSAPLKDNGFSDLDVFIARKAEDIVKQFNQYDRATLLKKVLVLGG